MKDKEKQTKVFDILDKIEFFQGQRAGRELWNNKSKEVQDKDIADFIKDINYIRSYLQDSVVLSREEYEKGIIERESMRNQITELFNDREQARKETAEKILNTIYDKLNTFEAVYEIDYESYVDDVLWEIAKQFGLEIKE